MVSGSRARALPVNIDTIAEHSLTGSIFSGATNYRGEIVFAGEGQGNSSPPALWVMNPQSPYNTTGVYLVFHCTCTEPITDAQHSPSEQLLWTSI